MTTTTVRDTETTEPPTQRTRRHRWVLPLQIGTATVCAVATVVLSCWVYFFAGPGAASQQHREAPPALRTAVSHLTDWSWLGLDGGQDEKRR